MACHPSKLTKFNVRAFSRAVSRAVSRGSSEPFKVGIPKRISSAELSRAISRVVSRDVSGGSSEQVKLVVFHYPVAIPKTILKEIIDKQFIVDQ